MIMDNAKSCNNSNANWKPFARSVGTNFAPIFGGRARQMGGGGKAAVLMGSGRVKMGIGNCWNGREIDLMIAIRALGGKAG